MKKALEILKQVKELSGWIKCGAELPCDEKIDEAIAEIEEAMKLKTCSMCKHLNKYYCYVLDTTVEELFYCIEYEPKDNA